MRSNLVWMVVLCLLLAVSGRPVHGQGEPAKPAAPDLSIPAQFLKIMTDSKLKYEIKSGSGPVAKPVKEMSCAGRSQNLKVVDDGKGGKSLQFWAPSEEAKPHYDAAEKLFSEKHFAEAGEEYRKLLALDPGFALGWLFYGDISYAQKDYEAALAAYRKAITLDSTLPQGHRFAADALLKLGRLDDAETEYVKAIIFDPSYDGAWQGLEVLGSLMAFKVSRPEFSPPENKIGERQGDKVQVMLDEKQQEWLGYLLCKAVWRNEEDFRRQRSGGKVGKEYSWSTGEERDCLENYLASNLNRVGGDLAKLPPLAHHLKEVADAGLLDGFVAVAVLGKRCPLASSILPDALHAEAERYVRTFVILRPVAKNQG
jgi:tetratricopeptide (TPR) repeat protein